MITVPDTYTTVNTRDARTPVYTIEIDALTQKFSTHPLFDYLTEARRDGRRFLFRLDDSAGTTVTDSSGNALNGTYHNSPTLSVTGLLVGDSNKAVSFNGIDQYISVTGTLRPDPDTFSIEMRLSITAIGSPMLLWDEGNNGVYLYITAGGVLTLQKRAVADIVAATIAFNAGQTYHIVVTKTGSAVKMWIDGADVTGSISNQTIEATGADLNIARDTAGAFYFGGTLDEVSLASTVLSQDRTQALYGSGVGLYALSGFSPVMQLPSGTGAQVAPERGQSSFSILSVSILDKDDAVTAIAMRDIEGRTATVKMGFTEICYSDFITIAAGIIDEVKLTADLDGYELVLRELFTLANKTTFNVVASTLAAECLDTDTIIQLPSLAEAQAFSGPGYVLIEDEYIQFTASGSGGFPVVYFLTGLTRFRLGSTLATHPAGAAVKEVVVLGPAHPIDIVQTVLTNTGNKGCGLTSSQIDTTGLAAVKAAMLNYNVRFIIDSPSNAKDWIEKEICQAFGLLIKPTADGLISARRLTVASTADAALTDDDIVASPTPQVSWTNNVRASMVNYITAFYDYSLTGGTIGFRNTVTYQDTRSVALRGKYPLTIESHGVQTSVAAAINILAAAANVLIARYRNGAPLIRLRVFLRNSLLEPGDIVSLTCRALPSPVTADRGLTNALCEVISRSIAFDQGFVDLVLSFVNWKPDLPVEAWQPRYLDPEDEVPMEEDQPGVFITLGN